MFKLSKELGDVMILVKILVRYGDCYPDAVVLRRQGLDESLGVTAASNMYTYHTSHESPVWMARVSLLASGL